MNYREEQFQKTKQSLFDALERLVSGEISNPELLDKKMNDKLKINRLSVEKEASMSVGVLRNHPDVVTAIKLANNNAKLKEANVNTTEELTDIEVDSKNEMLLKVKKQNKEQKAEIDNLNTSMSNQLARHQMLMVALTEELNQKQKENIFKLKRG